VWAKVTAIFHCGHSAARQKGNQTKWISSECHRLARPGERSGQVAQCRIFAWDANQPRRVSAKIRNAAGGFAGEHIQGLRTGFRLWERIRTLRSSVCSERTFKPKEHSSSHETFLVSSKRCDMPFLLAGFPGVAGYIGLQKNQLLALLPL